MPADAIFGMIEGSYPGWTLWAQRIEFMEIFRVSRDVYGREVVQGMSWDLLWLFFAAGIVFICAHSLYRWLAAPKQ